MANGAVKGFIGSIGSKIKSNKAVSSYLDNMSVSKHVQDFAAKDLKQTVGVLNDTGKQVSAAYKYHQNSGDSEALEATKKIFQDTLDTRNRVSSTAKQLASSKNLSAKTSFGAYKESVVDAGNWSTRIGSGRNMTPDETALMEYSAYAKAAKGYFGIGHDLTKGQKIARYGTTALGVGGTMAGARFVTGGSATRNSKGEKDIMGIPFV